MRISASAPAIAPLHLQRVDFHAPGSMVNGKDDIAGPRQCPLPESPIQPARPFGSAVP